MPLAKDSNHNIVQALRPGTNQEVAVQSSSTVLGNSLTSTVARLCASVDCRIAVGASPTATASSMRLPAGIVEYIGVTVGDKIAVIREAADGALTVTEMG